MSNESRTFEGRRYNLSRTSTLKKNATNHANALRDDGYFARIVKQDNGGYKVWKRRTPISKLSRKRR